MLILIPYFMIKHREKLFILLRLIIDKIFMKYQNKNIAYLIKTI